MRRVALLLALLPAGAGADEVYLRGGGQLSGVVIERTNDTVLIEVGPGSIRLPLARVERVVTGPSALAQYRARAASLASRDVGGWLELGRWAEAHGLLTQASEAFQHVLDVDPANAAAHQALGHVPLDGRWVSEDESYRARGYVQFEGAWVRPEERRAMLEERAVAIAQAGARAEAEARAREAEARARVAEAEAARAEAEARAASESSTGIPFGLMSPFYGPAVMGGFIPPIVGGYGFPPRVGPIHRRLHRELFVVPSPGGMRGPVAPPPAQGSTADQRRR